MKFIDELRRTFVKELFNSYIKGIFFIELYVVEGQRRHQKSVNPQGILGTDESGLNMFRFVCIKILVSVYLSILRQHKESWLAIIVFDCLKPWSHDHES